MRRSTRTMTRQDRNRSASRGFAIAELVGLVLIGAVVVAVLLPTAAMSRRDARAAQCTSNLRVQGVGLAAYGVDFQDRIASYSWRANEQYESDWSELRGPWNFDMSAFMAQATHILRTRTGRGGGLAGLLHNTSSMPHPRFNHLVLWDYLESPLPEAMAACPEDANLIASQQDPLNGDLWGKMPQGSEFQGQFNSGAVAQRYPYSTSYLTVPYAWTQDRADHIRPVPTTTHLFFSEQRNGILGNRLLSEVRFARVKVWVYEANDRHTRKDNPFYAYDEASARQLFFDLSVRPESSARANRGWDPANQSSPDTAYSIYTPLTTEPAAIGDPNRALPVLYRFTREGLAGLDYGLEGVRPGAPERP